MKELFANIYQHNLWGGRESRSGSGSDLVETAKIIDGLSKFLLDNKVGSMLDVPCGDFNWMPKVLDKVPDLSYIGGDIVPQAIRDNMAKRLELDFRVMDLTVDPLPQVELIFVRDCLGHLSNENIARSIENIKIANPKYLAATHWPEYKSVDIVDGGWQPINMDQYLDDSFKLVDELEEYFDGKKIGIWEIIK